MIKVRSELCRGEFFEHIKVHCELTAKYFCMSSRECFLVAEIYILPCLPNLLAEERVQKPVKCSKSAILSDAINVLTKVIKTLQELIAAFVLMLSNCNNLYKE
jgi:hypothetical protein